MTSGEIRAWLRRMTAGLTGALGRGLLGRSTHGYMKRFTGGDEYWDRVIAAQLGWPGHLPPGPDLDRCTTPGEVAAPGTLRVRDAAGPPPAPEYEPVHGLTRRQLDDYLARNPGYRPAYEAELSRHKRKDVREAKGPSRTWLHPGVTRHGEAVGDRRPDAA